MKGTQTIIAILLWIGGTSPLFAQEGPLKTYAEDNRDRKFCFYPSTLRMINVQGDTTFNEVVNGIRKILIYQLATSKVDPELSAVFEQYGDLGFEEYARVYGGGNDVILMGKEQRGMDEYVGVAGSDGEYFAFYLKGDVRWDKIATVIDRVRDNPLLSTLAPINRNVEADDSIID